jgi:hypothetical protein
MTPERTGRARKRLSGEAPEVSGRFGHSSDIRSVCIKEFIDARYDLTAIEGPLTGAKQRAACEPSLPDRGEAG